MSGEVGSPVCPCAGGAAHASAAGEGAPVDEAAHHDCRIRLLSVRETNVDDGMEFIGSANEMHVKGIDLNHHQLVIRYEVTGCTMQVTLWLEHEPGNTVHAGFYQGYEGEGVSGRRVVTIVNGESRAPGVHEALWDGRDKTAHHRILLDGQYLLKIQGLHDVTRSDQSTIKLMTPFAYNHGIHYGGINTTKRECEHASDRQQHLLDGTAYLANTILASTARDAWENMRQGALGIVSGHSNPNTLIFYPEASEPGAPVTYRRNRESIITQGVLAPTYPGFADSVDLFQEPPDALRDMLLSIMAGCRAGNEVLAVQQRLKYLRQNLDPGAADGDHGPRTTGALAVWQDWEGLSPADGSKTPETLARLGVDPSLDEVSQTRAVQTRLRALARRYDPGAEDGRWGLCHRGGADALPGRPHPAAGRHVAARRPHAAQPAAGRRGRPRRPQHRRPVLPPRLQPGGRLRQEGEFSGRRGLAHPFLGPGRTGGGRGRRLCPGARPVPRQPARRTGVHAVQPQ